MPARLACSDMVLAFDDPAVDESDDLDDEGVSDRFCSDEG